MTTLVSKFLHGPLRDSPEPFCVAFWINWNSRRLPYPAHPPTHMRCLCAVAFVGYPSATPLCGLYHANFLTGVALWGIASWGIESWGRQVWIALFGLHHATELQNSKCENRALLNCSDGIILIMSYGFDWYGHKCRTADHRYSLCSWISWWGGI